VTTRALDRFVEAQEPVYEQVIAELRAGRKRTHWMWFVFPQLQGLGRSETAWRYGIASAEEARAYSEHPVLGARLRECARLLLASGRRSAHDVFGPPDDLKLRSSMTLFERVVPEEPLFGAVLEKLCDGKRDDATIALLEQPG